MISVFTFFSFLDVEQYALIAVHLASDPVAREALSKEILQSNHRLFEQDQAVKEWEVFLESASTYADTKVMDAL